MLALRLLQTNDATALADLNIRNRDLLLPYFPLSSANIVDDETALAYILEKQKQAEAESMFCFGVILQDTLIGLAMIKNIDKRVPKCELAYWIDQKHSGKGYGTAATQLALNYSLETLGIKKVFLRIDPKNAGSIRVAEKCGFLREGYLKNDFRTGTGELIDLVYMAYLS